MRQRRLRLGCLLWPDLAAKLLTLSGARAGHNGLATRMTRSSRFLLRASVELRKLVGWMLWLLAGWLGGLGDGLLGCLVDCLLAWLLACLLSCFLAFLLSCLLSQRVDWLVGRLILSLGLV